LTRRGPKWARTASRQFCIRGSWLFSVPLSSSRALSERAGASRNNRQQFGGLIATRFYEGHARELAYRLLFKPLDDWNRTNRETERKDARRGAPTIPNAAVTFYDDHRKI
jgi:hypothetical protein